MKNKITRYTVCSLFLLLLLGGFTVLNIVTGSAGITVSEVFEIIAGKSADTSAVNIIMKIRLPRTLAALVLGGALSVSGYLLQNFFANPIAGPFVLGISSGAKLVVALTMIIIMKGGGMVSSASLIIASFIGSMLSMGIILLISGRVRNMSLLIVTGVMTGYICSAVTELAVTFADDSNIVNLHNWSMGTFSGTDMGEVKVMSVTVFAALICTFLISKPLSAYQLGEVYAENMGVNIKLFRFVLILLSSILSACVTAFAGPVSFLGVAAPHIIKGLYGTSKPIIIIPASFAGGAVMCLFCDLAARKLFSPTELSISTVTAIVGAPVVIAIMLKRGGKGEKHETKCGKTLSRIRKKDNT